VNRCPHEETEIRKFERMGHVPGFAHQCAACLKRAGGYIDVEDLPDGLDPGEILFRRIDRGRTGLGGRGNAARRARDDFRSSARWKKQRERVLHRDGYRCRYRLQGCTIKATQAHHESYHPDGIEKTPDSEIVALCKPCHDLHHELERGGGGAG